MGMPEWTDPKLGTMKRAALWLVQVIGEGNTFTKTDVAGAFPGVAQADRRVRDLRRRGWQIHTNREDVTLGQHEQRFVLAGEEVWKPGSGGSSPRASITDKRRREVLVADGNMCRSCGIAAGGEYSDGLEAAQIDIARRPVSQADGTEKIELVAECNRCRVGGRGLKVEFENIELKISGLGGFERDVLISWMKNDQRDFSKVEEIWASYCTLPAESRERVRAVLGI
ncbi:MULTISPECIES: hypothetical protein [Streptomyces]|uniref:HNH endonuclease n=1 Tax=Streptomyces diastaticus subsp. diastaticus TaxID=68040 RepID=A0ABQ1CXH6_STRDI|nr:MULTISPECIES: hypothetical protein [Streptomyces]MDQ0293469.1 hypothetical protein [Streptomyces sp. DSM 41037]GFH74831.1 hypothetical protein Sdia_55990 [Streptomyces diastaticus subsp. diastaticus]GGU05646.1 hypothetical protein GCM10015534_04680 [Streptomyces diastaticus subsp. diastaticus]